MRNRLMVGLASIALAAGMAAIPAVAGEGEGSARLSGDAETESQAAVGANDAFGGELRSHLLLRLTAEDEIAAQPTTPACGDVGDVKGATETHAEAAVAASAAAGNEVDADSTVEADASSAGDVDGTVGSQGSTAGQGAVEAGPDAAAGTEAEAESDADAETETEVEADTEAEAEAEAEAETETDAEAEAETEGSDLSISTDGEAEGGLSVEFGGG